MPTQSACNGDASFPVLKQPGDGPILATLNDGAPLAFRSGHVVGEIPDIYFRRLDLNVSLFGHDPLRGE
jgi:hypothetical protein